MRVEGEGSMDIVREIGDLRCTPIFAKAPDKRPNLGRD